MKVIAVRDYKEMSQTAAKTIIRLVKEKPDAVLGLATGGTVIGVYDELISDYARNETDYGHAHSVNLDEYVGLSSDHPQSYHSYMNEHLFQHINLPPEHCHVPQGDAEDPAQEAKQYDQLIAELDGVDLQLLGIGRNGHIGFNEPGTSFDSHTHLVELTTSTREANARYFTSMNEVPTHAITMGIASILKSKRIVLLVSGEAKAAILAEVLQSDVTTSIPATVLKMHPDVTVIADQDALQVVRQKGLMTYVHD